MRVANVAVGALGALVVVASVLGYSRISKDNAAPKKAVAPLTALQAGERFARSFNKTPPLTTKIVETKRCLSKGDRYACIFRIATPEGEACAVVTFAATPDGWRQLTDPQQVEEALCASSSA